MQCVTNPMTARRSVGILLLFIAPIPTWGQAVNDDCTNTIPIMDGITAYDTTGATTDGPPNPPDACNDFGAVQTAADIWFDYTATCTGNLVVTTCENLGGFAAYDSDLVIYNGCNCPQSSATLLGCNDDDPDNPCGGGTGDLCNNDDDCGLGEQCIDTDDDGVLDSCGGKSQSTVIAPVTQGECYKIRVGGFSDLTDSGPGVLRVTCVGCGDGACSTELGENCSNCLVDCSNAVCEEELGEDCINCEADCGTCSCNHASTGNCDSGQIGIGGAFVQECNVEDCWDLNGDGSCAVSTEDLNGDGICGLRDCYWSGMGFPIQVDAGVIDAVRFQVNTNDAGGDIYIVGTSADVPCQPNVTDLRRRMCCAITGLPTGELVDVVFEPLEVTEPETLWVLFVGRTGRAGRNNLGFFNGGTFKSHGMARNADGPSLANRAFGNLTFTGDPGDWSDLHDFNLGSTYCVELIATGQDPGGPYDCIANPEPSGGCCNVEGDGCQQLRGFECGIAGGLYTGDDTTCADCPTTCTADAGRCCDEAGNGTPGCNDPACCFYVCTRVDPSCCSVEWNADCAALALADENGAPPACAQSGQICAPLESEPITIATGPNSSTDGFLLTARDELGCAAGPGFGGEDGDLFNPAGDPPTRAAIFSDTVYFFKRDTLERQALCGIPNLLATNDDFSMDFEIPRGDLNEDGVPDALNRSSDTNGDGVADTLNSNFFLTGTVTDLAFELHQHVEQVVGVSGVGISVLTQDYTITNLDQDNAIEFILLRQADLNLVWDASEDSTNDVVGTGTNASPHLPRFVYQVEDGMPETAVTISSPDGDIYYGAKGGIDPDGDGAGPPFGFGTDVQPWDAFGVPSGWENVIAGVGANIDGESGPLSNDPNCDPCDGHIGLRVPVSLNPGESKRVTYQTTYGSKVPFPASAGPCNDDCAWDTDFSGEVRVPDLINLLSCWGPIGPGDPSSCICLDNDESNDIRVPDLILLLAAWGQCP